MNSAVRRRKNRDGSGPPPPGPRTAASASNWRLKMVDFPAPVPAPMTARPSEISHRVAHCWATWTGLRICGIRMPVHSLMRLVRPAAAVSAPIGQ